MMHRAVEWPDYSAPWWRITPARCTVAEEEPMSLRAFWPSVKSIFAPTEVVTSVILIVLVIGFAFVYFGARPSPKAPRATTAAETQVTTVPQASAAASPQPSTTGQAATGAGLGSILRAASTATHRSTGPTGSPTASASSSVSSNPSPSDSPNASPTHSPTDRTTPPSYPT